MTNKTRKYAWLASAVTAFAVVAALAAFVVLAGSPGSAAAHEPDTNVDNHCPDGTLVHDLQSELRVEKNADGTNHRCATPGTEPTPMPTATPMPAVVLTAPASVTVAALDNSMTVRWSAPVGYDAGAMITGYEITQSLYVQDASNPIAGTPPMTKKVGPEEMEEYFWGLSYATYYTYEVVAVFSYENAAGETMKKSGPAASMTSRTADSGGILYPAESGPTAPTMLTAKAAGADAGAMAQACAGAGALRHVAIAWEAPADPGQDANVPAGGCGECANQTGPHTGGDNAGITLLGEPATIKAYEVERSVDGGAWTAVAYQGALLYYADDDVTSGMTYAYRVRAINSASLVGPWEASKGITLKALSAAPEPPTSLVTTIKTPTGDDTVEDVELQWDPPQGDWRTAADAANGYSETVAYCIQYKAGDDAEWQWLRDQPHKYSPDGIGTVLTQEYTDGDAPEGEVAYRVASVFAHVNPEDHETDPLKVVSVSSGPSLWNEAKEVKTASHTIEPPPALIGPGVAMATSSAAGMVTVTWTPAQNADAHWVYLWHYDSSSGSYLDMAAGDADSATATGLASGSYVSIVAGAQEQPDGTWEYEWGAYSELVTVE